MPVHVEQMTTEVTAVEGDLPLSEKQVEMLIEKVLARLAEKKRDEGQAREATQLRTGATPTLPIEG